MKNKKIVFITVVRSTHTNLWIIVIAILLCIGLASIADALQYQSEAESGLLSGAASVVSDTSASDGRAVRLGTLDQCSGVTVLPGDTIQTKVAANPAGTTFCMQPGLYREQSVEPKDNMVFIGEGEVILNGSKVLNGFLQNGQIWSIGGQAQEGYVHTHPDQCRIEAPRCNRPEDLFIDNVALRHVATVAGVEPGTWHFDYTNDVIYIGDDPAGKIVETSTTRHAFSGYVDGVTIKNIIVEKYANPAQSGAIMAGFGPGPQAIWLDGWKIDSVTARLNHAGGVAYSYNDGFELTNSLLQNNGQQGIHGNTGRNIVIENNQILGNNTARYDFLWEGGGTKFQSNDGIIVRGNISSNNYGPGLWTDIDNVNVLYENNTVVNNLNVGIFHEISYDAVIRNNTVIGNGLGDPQGWCYGAGIQISASQNVEVYGNTVRDNNESIIGIFQNRGGDYTLRNMNVHDNLTENATVTNSRTGICSDAGTDPFTGAFNNRFTSNTYTGTGQNWTWNSIEYGTNFVGWQATGNDATGSYTQ